jgi:hypothetical protein
MSQPKWLDKKETPRKFSQRREKLIGKRLGAKLTPNSGAMWHTKADAYTKEELFEIKSTEATQMIVHKDWLEKVRNEALKQGKDPVLLLDFGSIIMVGQIRKV